jgi:DNA-binding NtrC family response regulator
MMDVRIISPTATCRRRCARQIPGGFGYRLNVIHISVPPLRERIRDPATGNYYLKKLAAKEPVRGLSDEAMRFLGDMSGRDVRELINAWNTPW